MAAALRGLMSAGHELALVSECDAGGAAPPLAPQGVREWCLAESSLDRLESEVRAWKPDVVYAHMFQDLEFERRTMSLARAIYFAHNFGGTCISGHKSLGYPRPSLCERRFGPACLLYYHARRCGGLSPITMLRSYAEQRARLSLLHRYAGIVTHSRRMEAEYLRHGLPPARVHRIPYCVEDGPLAEPAEVQERKSQVRERPHLVFLGRMTAVKGGDMLLRALPLIREALGRPLRVTFAGDGPARREWEQMARGLELADRTYTVRFTGWVSPGQRRDLLDLADLLVVPSVWPEPFGIVGIEAGRRGVPAAAYASGGIPDWLRDGVNGFLASADPPTPQGLAEAVVRCLADPNVHTRLRLGALDQARRFTMAEHLQSLLPILTRAAEGAIP